MARHPFTKAENLRWTSATDEQRARCFKAAGCDKTLAYIRARNTGDCIFSAWELWSLDDTGRIREVLNRIIPGLPSKRELARRAKEETI